jgi:hypothetical protein
MVIGLATVDILEKPRQTTFTVTLGTAGADQDTVP